MASKLTIDLVTHDPASGEFVIYLVEDGPWPTESSEWPTTLARIQTRIFDAIDAVIDGHFAREFPDSVKKKMRLQIDSPHGIPRPLQDLIQEVKNYIDLDSEYRTALEKSQAISGFRFVTGAELGRFKN